jgi:hypothetical protein
MKLSMNNFFIKLTKVYVSKYLFPCFYLINKKCDGIGFLSFLKLNIRIFKLNIYICTL